MKRKSKVACQQLEKLPSSRDPRTEKLVRAKRSGPVRRLGGPCIPDQVTGRAGTWNGILQEFNAERVLAANLAGGTIASSIYVRPLGGATLSGSNAKFQFKVRFRRDGQNTFFTIGQHTYQSGDDLSQWVKLAGSISGS